MDVFVTYDAMREHAFVCFRKSGMDSQVAGYLDDGLYVEFGVDDPVEMRVLSVDHPFYARTPDFGDRLRRLIGPTIEARLRECDQRSTATAEEIPVAEAEVTQLHAAWQEAVAVLNGMSADPWLARLSVPLALARGTVSAIAERAGKLIREWRLPILLDPVVAREAVLKERPGQAAAASAFSGMIDLPAELADILQAEPRARADLARGMLNLRILLRPGSTPPPLMVQLAALATGRPQWRAEKS